MCKIFGWKIDDDRFLELTPPQWAWYAQMIYNEEKEEFEKERNITEYLASFWNPEAVRKIHESRESRDKHNFMSDKEFEQSVLNEEYKNNPWIKRLKKIQELDANFNSNDVTSRHKRGARMTKAPTDLSYLASLTSED